VAVQCGHVYFLNLPIAGKEKLVVPAFVEADSRIRFFVINTERTDFQKNQPEVSKHVLPLPQNGHQHCLTHDSWLACHEVVGGYKVADVDAIAGCYRGPLTPAMVSAVKDVIKDSRLHSEADKAAILAQWPN
jgi:hypothetical protein